LQHGKEVQPDTASSLLTLQDWKKFASQYPKPILLCDPVTLKILDVNQAALTHYGYPRDLFLNLSIEDLLSPAESTNRSEAIRTNTIYYDEMIHAKYDGSLTPVGMLALTLNLEGATARLIITLDFTDRREENVQRGGHSLAEALRDTTAALNSTLNLDELLDRILANAGRVVPHDSANIMLVEEGTASMVRARGYEERGAIDALLSVYFPANTMFEMRVLIANGEPVVIPDTRANPAWASIPESVWIRSYLGSPIRMEGEVIGFLNLDSASPNFFNPSHIESLQAFADQAAIAIKNAHLYEQARKLAVLQERERLARDLHDAVSQTLWSASLIADVLPTLWEQNPGEARQSLEELRELTHAARDEMRSLLLELRPGGLTQMALAELLSQLVKTLSGRATGDITLDIVGKAELPAEVQVAVYRIAQEGLNNAIKHSHASEINVWLNLQPNRADLRIRDNGRGFDPQKVRAGHLGLGIMRERAAAIDATLSIDSHKGSGTEIHAQWANPR